MEDQEGQVKLRAQGIAPYSKLTFILSYNLVQVPYCDNIQKTVICLRMSVCDKGTRS